MLKHLSPQNNYNYSLSYIFNLALLVSLFTLIRNFLNKQKNQHKINNFYILEDSKQLVILKKIIKNTAVVINPIKQNEDTVLKEKLLDINFSSQKLTLTKNILDISDVILENSFRYTKNNSGVKLLSCHNIQSCICLVAFGENGTAIFHFNNNVEKLITKALNEVFDKYESKEKFSQFVMIGFWGYSDMLNPFISPIAATVKKCLNSDNLINQQSYSHFFDDSNLTKNIFINVETNQIIIENSSIKDIISFNQNINEKYKLELEKLQKDQLIQTKFGETFNTSQEYPKSIPENELNNYGLLNMSKSKIN
jgi:hypothetical protein